MGLRTGRRNPGREKPDFKRLAAGERMEEEEEDAIEKSFPIPIPITIPIPTSKIIMTWRKRAMEETLCMFPPSPSRDGQMPLPFKEGK